MRRTTLAGVLALALSLVPAACAGNHGAQNAPRVPRTVLHVVNRQFRAYTLYVNSGLQQQRLGTVQPVSSADLVIPAAFVQTPTSLRFIADPIGSDAVTSTFNTNVSPGETVSISIVF